MSYENPWFFQGKIFDSESINDSTSFVYLITNNSTQKQYIGKKIFWSNTTKPPLKGQKRKRKIRKESDWKEYYGSCKQLQEDIEAGGRDMFSRQILVLCVSKGEASYWETKLQLENDVLLNPDKWYNDFVGCRIHRKHLTRKK